MRHDYYREIAGRGNSQRLHIRQINPSHTHTVRLCGTGSTDRALANGIPVEVILRGLSEHRVTKVCEKCEIRFLHESGWLAKIGTSGLYETKTVSELKRLRDFYAKHRYGKSHDEKAGA